MNARSGIPPEARETAPLPERGTVVIGVDPGSRGAFARLEPGRAPQAIDGTEGVLAMLAELMGARAPGIARGPASSPVLGTASTPHVFLEWGIPVQKLMPSVVGAYKMGCAFGELVGALKLARVPYTLVRPSQWQRAMLTGTPYRLPTKERARIRARQLFPEVDLYGPKGGYRDGRGDALLIAEYGRRVLNHGFGFGVSGSGETAGAWRI